jgi:hypothetical protein
MRAIVTYSLFTCLFFSIACSNKKDATETDQTASPPDWKEMDSFHMIMAEAFHPYKDSSNLEPVKKLAEEMATEAEQWERSTLPTNVDTEQVKHSLGNLKADTRALADLIKNGGDDQAIGASLTGLHDSFHSIMEAWHSGEKMKHEH